MDRHIQEFYFGAVDDPSSKRYHEVIPLHRTPNLFSWQELKKRIPNLPRGWFELAHLKAKDRVEFTCDYWEAKLPYHPSLCTFLDRFFASLDDIGVFIIQKKWDDPYTAEMVYSIAGNDGFYRGALPATEADIQELTKNFSEFLLPGDYLDFLEIHNGWWKTTDCTGVIPSNRMFAAYQQFQRLTSQEVDLPTVKGIPVNPKKLIPFYESFGMPYFQCFWAEWYPENEMGNVYYSGVSKSILAPDSNAPSFETMAFPTFFDWLMFYLERVE